ncbi:MAG: CehA/McbA family metallohydrolase [Myxococcota bacterium]|nr:CehA/McbA family metallohydrolase [Myxococcota bacterium]
MLRERRSLGELVAMGIIAGLTAFGLAYAARPRGAVRPPPRAGTVLQTRTTSFELHPAAARITVRSRDATVSRDIDLALVIDGSARPLALARDDLRSVRGALRATVPVPLGDSLVEATLELMVDNAADALSIVLSARPSEAAAHTVALRAEIPSEGQIVFVSGVGQIADRASVTGGALVVDVEPHPIGIVSSEGPIAIEAMLDDPNAQGEPTRVTATSPPRTPTDEADQRIADLRIAMGASSMAIWRTLFQSAGLSTAMVRGRVTGTGERALVVGRDAQGNPQLRAFAANGGTFQLDAPTSVVQWYAAIDPGRASGVATFVPGSGRELVLDVSPGGELHVTIVDADGGKPLTARLLVHGLEGTVDPSFGPDYRASGAGPVIDALRGEVMTPLPSGHYRVAATKGLEWSIDEKFVDIGPGRVSDVELAPRHVIPTPGVLGCDLHVHARPSFDSPVTPEDRVLSLVAAGIDFAVPTEHNVVGDYSSAVDTLDLRHELLSVTGVEVTTYNRGFGHFGVFPYPPQLPVPPYRHTTMGAIFRAVRAGDPNRYFQLNHPRLPKGIGYLSNIGFDPRSPRSHIRGRIDFDGIEVYNGYESEQPERVERVLHDYWALLDYGWHYTATGSSDSHRIQFRWAGYPRTMVTIDPHATADMEGNSVDPLVVVANIKKGHATVTSGPIIELDLAGAGPGDEAITTDDPIHGHLRIRAAPWVDVTQVEIVVSGRVVRTFDVPSRPTQLGPEVGSLEEAQARTIRFDRDIDVMVGDSNGWVQVVARGERRLNDVLPFMPVPPLAFTNPVYVVRHPEPPPPFPGAPGEVVRRPGNP